MQNLHRSTIPLHAPPLGIKIVASLDCFTDSAQMIAEFLYPSWWPFSCHEYAPSDICCGQDSRSYYPIKDSIGALKEYALKQKIREIWIAEWMEQDGLRDKKISECKQLFD